MFFVNSNCLFLMILFGFFGLLSANASFSLSNKILTNEFNYEIKFQFASQDKISFPVNSSIKLVAWCNANYLQTIFNS